MKLDQKKLVNFFHNLEVDLLILKKNSELQGKDWIKSSPDDRGEKVGEKFGDLHILWTKNLVV